FQADDGIRDATVTGVQTCALPIYPPRAGELAVDDGRMRQVADELGDRPVDRGQKLEEVAERGNGVVGGQEAREDVAAADCAGERSEERRGGKGGGSGWAEGVSGRG